MEVNELFISSELDYELLAAADLLAYRCVARSAVNKNLQ